MAGRPSSGLEEPARGFLRIVGSWGRVFRWAKQHGVKVAFGTDLLFQPEGTHQENITPTPVLKGLQQCRGAEDRHIRQLRAVRHERRAQSYKEAKLGVLQEGAWADMLLVDGDPTQDIDVLSDHERNFVVIIKDRKTHRNTLR
jgi:imidazolonepropionase-like amidohydrolase